MARRRWAAKGQRRLFEDEFAGVCYRCDQCGEVKPRDAFTLVTDGCGNKSRLRKCKDCVNTTRAPHLRRYNLASKYQINEAHYATMLDRQHGRCAICEQAQDDSGDAKKLLQVDHDHDTGQVRGLLCPCCNKALGLFKDRPAVVERAFKYLQHWKGGPSRIADNRGNGQQPESLT